MREHLKQGFGQDEVAEQVKPRSDILARYRPWFYAAAVYNLLWGLFNILFPNAYFILIDMEPPQYAALWQVVGMFVLVYVPAYWWAARDPGKYPQFIIIGLLGKLLGPSGFVYSVLTGQLPLVFGWTILTNDIIWWPSFFAYLRDVAKMRGGIRQLL